MLAKQRQDRILTEVRRHGGVRVSDLVDLLGVSDMTVRRDLDVLSRKGLVDKVHGGASALGSRTADEPGFEAKSLRELAEKEAIAARAAELVRPGTAIGLSAGTTTWALARRLRDVPGLTVVTNSIQVLEALHQTGGAGQSVVLTGGVRTPSDALVGPLAVAALDALHLDLVFMGTHGMDDRSGFTTPNLMEAETNRALVRAARRLVVVADHSKWGVVGLSAFAGADEADVLVTDSGLDQEAQELMSQRVGELLVVEAESADSVETDADAADEDDRADQERTG
jgi:DeoR/GlpR family transcriptional regulator of sugar metabolism